MIDAKKLSWDYYVEGYRLHERTTKQANFQARQMFQKAIKLWPNGGRAQGFLSFSTQIALLNDWISADEAANLLAQVVQDVNSLDKSALSGMLATVVERIGNIQGNQKPSDILASTVVPYYAATALNVDPEDYENWWSCASACTYSPCSSDKDHAIELYDEALDRATKSDAPSVNIASLIVDRADTLFFFASGEDGGKQQILEAIGDVKDAMSSVPDDPKRQNWNWTLGWAYYELGNIVNQPSYHAQSLALLSQFRRPTDLILKNIIADHVALEEYQTAEQLAAEFLSRNPNYDLSIENRWPSLDENRRVAFKRHLSRAGLPGDPESGPPPPLCV